MDQSILIGGFGGQGVQTLGKLLTYAANDAGLNVTFLPSYGGEKRGGISNCTVVLSDRRIGSPQRNTYDYVVAMNIPSYHNYEGSVKAGGLLIVNSSLIEAQTARTDIAQVNVPLNNLVEEIGSAKAINIILYGFLVAYLGILPVEIAKQTLEDRFGSKKAFAEMNRRAFDLGVSYAEELKRQ